MPDYGDAAFRPYAVVQEWRLLGMPRERAVRSVHHSFSVADRRARAARDACTWLWNNWAPWFVFLVIDRRTGDVLRTHQ